MIGEAKMIPGEVITGSAALHLAPEAERVELTVVNTGDRPIQVGSHYHFAATNPALEFDRAAAWGLRLAVPAGTSVRFEPGVDRVVRLIPLRGARRVPGLRPEHAGDLSERPTTGRAPR
jgi:urease subunit beta